MAETATIARPYARAAFEHARAAGALSGWSEQLQLLSAVVQDSNMQEFLDRPDSDSEARYQAVVDICGERLSADGRNFVRLLTTSRRLRAIADIAAQYEAFRAEAERTVEAEVTSARKLTKEQEKRLIAALKARLDRDVVLKCRVDASLLGGAVIRAGDLVIDGSAQGRLEQLAAAMSQ
jgi:F-type H+-transporting ATPase subunit delta